jgi:hypothetical protein
MDVSQESNSALSVLKVFAESLSPYRQMLSYLF